MVIKVKNWKISSLLKIREKINDQPEYQRGKVWSVEKEALLIDSILRGIDIPKIYLRSVNKGIFDYEIADGQQRLNAIFNFYDGEFKLIKKVIKGLEVGDINGFSVGGKQFSELNGHFKSIFLNTEITISLIEECTEDEVRLLFGRLQEGVSLNSAEKRNSIISTVGKHIDSIVLNHRIFSKTKIPKKRFKHQDYMAQVVALLVYKNKEDLKANTLEKLYLDNEVNLSMEDLKLIDKILDDIYDLDQVNGKKIVNQFSFIDLFLFLMNNAKDKKIDFNGFKKELDKFEECRLKERKNLEQLSLDTSEYNKNLYKYIVNYDRSGSLKESVNKRAVVFEWLFKKYLL